jgi:S-DNA-T family DNA segregation ATPase FtsK/SpoIIIE
MARSRSAARPQSKRPERQQSRSPGRTSPASALFGWLLRVCRPRTALDFLTLFFVCLGLFTLGAVTAGDLTHHRTPGTDLAWCAPLFLAAAASRLSPWWRARLREMTAERAQQLAGSALLILVAIVLSWHVLSTSLGFGSAYPLFGPLARPPGAIAALIVLALVGFALLMDVPIGLASAAAIAGIGGWIAAGRERRTLAAVELETLPEVDEYGQEPEFDTLPALYPREVAPEPPAPAPRVAKRLELPEPASPPAAPAQPPIEIFRPAARLNGPALDHDEIARRIEETLDSFNVKARVVGHHSGPVVTQFDIQPERGVKVKSITSLQNDLALALAAPTIRIQAPVPGRPVVGIEIPNASASTVSLRELLEHEAFQKMTSPLSVVLGKDVAGKPSVIDLARMPHLLIAGATGSGKSVCVNVLISCLLYRNSPEDVRLMMVDPKMVELTVYNGVPHLLSPVVTQMDKVVGVLQWALREMERRYQLFADNTVRNIQRFNEKMGAAGKGKLPYIVLIVDELADLMMVAPEDVEDAVCRLAQLARAAGIHLVIATQRPSVDVVTGLIKANFPARIAFAMTSQVDSRTILDMAGAEKLLGRGDMLYLPGDAPKPVRLQGAFVTDQEIERLVQFWQRQPLQAAIDRIAAEEFEEAEKAASEVKDELLDEAIRTVREFQHASVSLLQRRLRIGYARAARLMDQLEERGVVGPADGSKQRPVLPPSESEPDDLFEG